mgnify:CR=1 FL=1
MSVKPVNQRAWWLVVPVLVLVAFNALMPLMTVVNYSLQETFGNNLFFWHGVGWFEDVLNSERFHAALGRQMLFTVIILLIEVPLGVGVALAMSLRRDVEATEAWRSNAEDGVAWLKTTDTALASGIEVIQRVRELAVQGANGALPQNARNTIALEVEGLTSSLIEVGNTSYGGRFIFGGATYDQSPLDATGAPTTGNTAAVSREVGRGPGGQILSPIHI